MPLTDDEQATLRRLRARLDKDMRSGSKNGHRVHGFLSLRAYYQGMQRLEQLGLAVPEDLRKFVTIVAWPRIYVDAIVSRLRPQGFTLDGEAEDELWSGMWQGNNLDAEFRMALTDMLVYRRGYLCAGTNEDNPDRPLVTVESPLQMVHEWSNRRRRVTNVARFYTEDVAGKSEHRATLYTPNSTVWLARASNGKWAEDNDGQPDGDSARDDHGTGRVPVHPIVNRASSDDRYGESEMAAVIGLTDAAARALTNAQVATEVMALPQRFAAGMTAADFKDPATGEALTAWESYFGAVWAADNPDAKFGQFAAANLENFKTIVGLYAQLTAGITGLPMRYLGQLSDNPPSADGIRADESRLVGTAEEKQEFAAGAIEDCARTWTLFKEGEDDPALMQLETDWRNAATPTIAQAADAAVKLKQAGVYSTREALRSMGKSGTQIDLILDEIRAESDDSELAQATRALGAPQIPAAPDAA